MMIKKPRTKQATSTYVIILRLAAPSHPSSSSNFKEGDFCPLFFSILARISLLESSVEFDFESSSSESRAFRLGVLRVPLSRSDSLVSGSSRSPHAVPLRRVPEVLFSPSSLREDFDLEDDDDDLSRRLGLVVLIFIFWLALTGESGGIEIRRALPLLSFLLDDNTFTPLPTSRSCQRDPRALSPLFDAESCREPFGERTTAQLFWRCRRSLSASRSRLVGLSSSERPSSPRL